MLLLISYDHGNSSSVKIHGLFADFERGRALELYYQLAEAPLARSPGDDAESHFHTLVELLKIPEGFESFLGHGAFWGPRCEAVEMLAGNNR